MDLAPIALFVYNRSEHIRRTLESLRENVLASESQLFVFCDGPKSNSTEDNLAKITEVRDLVKEQGWSENLNNS